MFESIFNYIFIFIPIAIFIGRIVTRAKAKRSPPPPPPKKKIPVHFEDYKEAIPQEVLPQEAPSPAKTAPKARVELQPQGAEKQEKPGLLKLSHLPPLKQAVVMAEILGPPKALQ